MSEKLKDYRSKRNFEKTKEPDGSSEKKSGVHNYQIPKALKFVVQYHTSRKTHYDFRLEWRGALLSWAVPKGPSYNPKDKRLAIQVEDHPLEYADFEGVIPKGEYGGGTVMIWDEGLWFPQEGKDADDGLKKGSLKFVLEGSRLKGKWALVKLKGEDSKDSSNWLLIKENDEYKKPTSGITNFKTSVRSNRTDFRIKQEENAVNKKNPFDIAEVQLAKLVEKVPDEDGWLYEVKYDGYRIVAFAQSGKVRLMTRNGYDFSDRFRALAKEIAAFSAGRAMILDGEAVVADEHGRSDFQALQQFVRKPDESMLTFMVFDLLALDGEDLRGKPLIERKNRLEKLLKNSNGAIRFSNYVIGRGKECFEAARKLELEGIVGKKSNSVYVGGRNGDWIKIKCYNRQEFVIGGYTLSTEKTEGVSALLLGFYEGKKLRYAGRAGTGFNKFNLQEINEIVRKNKTAACPFEDAPKARNGEKIFWLKPAAVAEIQFAEWTRENVLRQASFKAVRIDKDPKEVVMESPKSKEAEKKVQNKNKSSVDVCGVVLSNPDKIVYKKPEIRKIDVAEYYEKVSERFLKYAGGRVLSVVRCHKGISDSCFFKKHPAGEGEGMEIISIKNSEGVSGDYFYVETETGLIREAQLGSLEFHVWGSRAHHLEKPDMMVFDLDPDAGMDLQKVRQGAKDLKKILDGLKLKSFLKTSGGKGYHIVVPFKPSVGWDEFHDFAKSIAQIMEAKWPERYTCNIRKNKRKGKIFIDWARNGRGSTSIAPYSLRARPGAKVSMPISWSELDTVAPDGIDIFEAVKRLKKSDPWKNFYNIGQELRAD